MSDKILKVLLFMTRSGNQYMYDGVTGVVYPVDGIMVDYINCIQKDLSKEECFDTLMKKYNEEILIKGAMAQIDKLVSDGSILASREGTSNRRRMTCKDVNSNLIDLGATMQLTLNVTEDCNLRCKYCYLSEVYDYTRNRTCKRMSYETATKSMDIFFKRLQQIKKFIPNKRAAITFYGGEPLLEYELVKKCVSYARENSPVDLIFSITTNGTLLNDEIIDFLVENNFYIGISLDGSQANHDRNRVFANGSGSHDIVVKNIKKITSKYPQYTNLSILSVLDFKTDLLENEEYYKKENLPRIGFITLVSDSNTSYYEQFTKEDMEEYAQNYQTLLNQYVDDKINGEEITPFSKAIVELPLCNVLVRSKKEDKRLPFLPFTGACVPGAKISVRATGELDICERVNGTMPIGNVNRGLINADIVKVVNEYNDAITKDCGKCPIQRNCSMCYARCCGDGKFEKQDCSGLIRSFGENLSVVYTILEKNPHAFDDFLIPVEALLNN